MKEEFKSNKESAGETDNREERDSDNEEYIQKMLKEDNEMILRHFVMYVGYDYQKDYSPHIHPTFSAETVRLWEEIEKRMKKPVNMEFDEGKCLSELRELVKKQSEILKGGPDYTTSYHYGLKSGLDKAISVVQENIRRKKEIEEHTEDI